MAGRSLAAEVFLATRRGVLFVKVWAYVGRGQVPRFVRAPLVARRGKEEVYRDDELNLWAAV
eukprot:11204150-Lingulodinium_polyedra.AAC.1